MQYLAATDISYTGPHIPCFILDQQLSALIDTGLSVTAVSSMLSPE